MLVFGPFHCGTEGKGHRPQGCAMEWQMGQGVRATAAPQPSRPVGYSSMRRKERSSVQAFASQVGLCAKMLKRGTGRPPAILKSRRSTWMDLIKSHVATWTFSSGISLIERMSLIWARLSSYA